MMAIKHTRRHFLAATSGLTTALLVRPTTLFAQDDVLAALVKTYAAGGVVREGRVKFNIAALVDNGNSVPVEVTVESPMTADDHVTGIAIFNEKNPQHEVAELTLNHRAGRAHVATRIRLATTQKLVAVAKMRDGTCWTQTVDVVVTLAACGEE